MADKGSSDTSTVQGAYRTAKDAVSSAAEQIRATAPDAYDTGARAARYVGNTASEHPISLMLATAALAYLAGYVSNTGSGQSSWQKRGSAMSDRVRSAAPSVSDAASNAGDYVTRNVREYPLSGILSAAAVGCALTYFLKK